VPSVSDVDRKSQMASARRCLGVVDCCWVGRGLVSGCPGKGGSCPVERGRG
jgi:hypothetical protein